MKKEQYYVLKILQSVILLPKKSHLGRLTLLLRCFLEGPLPVG